MLLDSAERVAPWLAAWDGLACACRRPLAAPGWMLAWWRHAAPEGAQLRTVVVEEDGRAIGVAPYYVEPRGSAHSDYRLLGSGLFQRLEPLAAPGREQDVARAMAGAFAEARPRPSLVSLEGVPADSCWPRLLRRAVRAPLGVAAYRTSVQDAPVVTLDGGFEAWLGSKSSNFRQQLRRMRRKLEAEGAVLRPSGPDELDADVAAFAELHAGRWDERGGSGVLSLGRDRIEAMLRDAGRALMADGRFRLWVIEADGRPISAQVFVAAGGEVTYWNGGFDEEWARFKPAMVTIFRAIEDAFERGDERLDLGAGAQDYKLRFSDSNDPLQWAGLIPRRAAWPLVRARLAPDMARARVRKLVRR